MKRTLAGVLVATLGLGTLSLTFARDAGDPGKTGAAKNAKLDELLIKAQKVCPVSGQKLGSMGQPVKTTLEGHTTFLCCKGCTGKKPDPEHLKTVHANVAAAQEICPVMKKPLPKKPASFVVEERLVFVCCPPCTKKITADPEKYLTVVDQQLRKNVGEKSEKQ